MLPSEMQLYDMFRQMQKEDIRRPLWEAYEQSLHSLLTLMDTLDDSQCRIIHDYIDAFLALQREMLLLTLSENK